MKTINAIIVDDEPNARVALRGLLLENFPQINLIAECISVPDAVKSIQSLQPELVFLDIAMPGYSGFELLNFFEEKEINFKIIFVTAYSEHSLKAFEISAVDYLLKPVRLEQLARAISKLEYFSVGQEFLNYQVLKENMDHPGERKIVLQNSETIFVVKVSDIIYLQAEGSYTRFHTLVHGTLLISKKLIDFEYLEKMGNFFRTHRSYLVNINHIHKVDKKALLITMNNEDKVDIAADKKNALLQKILR